MSDAFGIGQALEGCAEIYFRSARRSGRTTALIESLKSGDRIICADVATKRHLERYIKAMPFKVEVIVLEPAAGHRLGHLGTSPGRTIFDHSWVEAYYRQELARATRSLDELRKHLSGQGVAHLETHMTAQEIAKWRQ